jgi:hypothetical protein
MTCICCTNLRTGAKPWSVGHDVSACVQNTNKCLCSSDKPAYQEIQAWQVFAFGAGACVVIAMLYVLALALFTSAP